MAEYPIDIDATSRQLSDGTYTLTIKISGIPSQRQLQRFVDWTGKVLRENLVDINGRIAERVTQ